MASYLRALERCVAPLELEINPEAQIGRGSATFTVLCGLCLSLLAESSFFRSFEVSVPFLMQPPLVDVDLPNRPSQPQTSQLYSRKQRTRSEHVVWEPRIILRAFEGLFAPIEGLLGFLWGCQIDHEVLLTIGSATSSALIGILLSLIAAEDGLPSVLGPSWAASGCSWAPPGSSFGALRCDVEVLGFFLVLLKCSWASFSASKSTSN